MSGTNAGRRPRLALEGIRVLELTTAVAGPVAGHILGDMGADVIKVEEPTARAHLPQLIAPAREGAPDRPYNRIPNYVELNRGKRLVTLDISQEAGREVFLGLAAVSDVMIENFSPRVVGNLGVDYEELKKVNPSIIAVSMPGFGKTGPYRERGSYGPGIDAMSGMSHLTGYADRMPGKPANFFCDQNAGLHTVFCILSALRHRRNTGQGQYIEMPMLDGELQVVAPAIMDAALNGRDRSRIGNRHEWYAPHGVYPCAGEDEWVAVAVTTDDAFRSLCTVIGRPELASDARYAEQEARHANQEDLNSLVAAWTRSRRHHEAQKQLQAAGVSAGAVLKVSELFDNPQLSHRGTFSWREHPEIGRMPHTRTAWLSRRGNSGVNGPEPVFADGNDYAFRELLGMGDEEVEALVANGTTAYEPAGLDG